MQAISHMADRRVRVIWDVFQNVVMCIIYHGGEHACGFQGSTYLRDRTGGGDSVRMIARQPPAAHTLAGHTRYPLPCD